MKRYYRQNDPAESLLLEAMRYDRQNDVYNAVKLYKRVIKLAPDWSAPFSMLSQIYSRRREWTPALHYSQLAVEHNPFDDIAYKNMGLAATALKKWTVAKTAWSELGYRTKELAEKPAIHPTPIIIRINPAHKPELVLAHQIGPVRAKIASVPQPSSNYGFEDIVLIDDTPSGYHHINGRQYPVYNALDLIQPSLYFTFAIELYTDNMADVLKLEQLCHESSLGFDNWSNAYRMVVKSNSSFPETHEIKAFNQSDKNQYLVAIAAERNSDVSKVLDAWSVIALKEYGHVKRF